MAISDSVDNIDTPGSLYTPDFDVDENGNADFHNNKGVNLATPTAGTDAANKAYADSKTNAYPVAYMWFPVDDNGQESLFLPANHNFDLGTNGELLVANGINAGLYSQVGPGDPWVLSSDQRDEDGTIITSGNVVYYRGGITNPPSTIGTPGMVVRMNSGGMYRIAPTLYTRKGAAITFVVDSAVNINYGAHTVTTVPGGATFSFSVIPDGTKLLAINDQSILVFSGSGTIFDVLTEPLSAEYGDLVSNLEAGNMYIYTSGGYTLI